MKGENIIAESVEKVIYTKWVAGTSAAPDLPTYKLS
jgi:hypothetical protein